MLSRKWLAKHWLKFAIIFLAGLVFVVVSNLWMIAAAREHIFSDARLLPTNDVALVLGTGPFTAKGNTNLHFVVRVEAAAKLFKSGKVKHLLLSGDNHIRGYDEPTEMKNALLKLGVPEAAMTLDYAGLRTLDSMERARKIFGQTKLTLITEDFHAARSYFLARHYGIDAIVFCGEDLPAAWTNNMRIREAAARPVAVLDAFVWHRGARHLGDPIAIHVAGN